MVIQKGEKCPKCKRWMERRWHGPNETSYKMKAYYYSEWDYCRSCRHVQHYEKYKVIPVAPIAPFVKSPWEL
jgi:hypothetical protein